jgi:hypothetical protein
MDSSIRSLRTSTLKAQVERCRIALEALESAFIQPDLTPEKRLKLFWQWDAVMRDSEAAEYELALLELDNPGNSAEL